MSKIIFVWLLGIFLIGCLPPGQIKKQTTPGHIQQETGYNPASGKVKSPK